MTATEYEQYVTEIVREFDFCKQASVSNNRKFEGKRQPGEYEIDIAIEVRFSEVIYFLMIVECKHWNRPVDRPVIQNLAQTRDAISAHKAVVASAEGFSKEAISVAKAHGIALWHIPERVTEEERKLHSVHFSLRAPSLIEQAINSLYRELRDKFLDIIKMSPTSKRYLDLNSLVAEVYLQITGYEGWKQTKGLLRLSTWEEYVIRRLTSLGLSDPLVTILLMKIVSDDKDSFRSAIMERIPRPVYDFDDLIRISIVSNTQDSVEGI